MSIEEIEVKLKDMISKFDIIVSAEEIDENTNLSKIGIDSMSVIKLVVLIEKEFSIEFGDEEMTPKNIETIGKISKFILNKMNSENKN